VQLRQRPPHGGREHKADSMSQVGFQQRLQQELNSLRENWNRLPEKSKNKPQEDEYVRLAFQNANLDVLKPEDQVLFLLGVARVLRGRKGLKPPGFLNTLARDAEAAIQKFGLTGKRQACEVLAQRNEYRTKYGKYTSNTLLKLLDKATDRYENPDYEELVKGRPTREKYDRVVLYKKKARNPRRGKKKTRENFSPLPTLKWSKGRLCRDDPQYVLWKGIKYRL
jgi:hypothetical protein